MPSPNTASWTRGITPHLLFLVLAATLGPLQFGYHLSELNAPSKVIRCQTTSSIISRDLPQCIPMTDAQFATVSSIYTLGGLAGALSAGSLSSRKGRLFPMRLSAPLHILGSLLEAGSPNIVIMAIGRFLSGLGSGAAMVVGPIYISEIAPAGAKGVLGAGTQIMTNIGILVSQVLGYFLSYASNWRFILGTAGVLGFLQLISLAFASESPEWLRTHGQSDLAWKIVKIIRGGSVDSDEASKWSPHDEQHDESQGLLTPPQSPSERATNSQQPPSIGFFAAARHPDHWRAVVAVIGIMVAQQLTGINSVFFYSTDFLSAVVPTGAALITVVVGAFNLVITIACSPLSDKIGRKPCLLLSIAGMGINAVILGCAIMFDMKILASVATLLFVCSFGIGLGPVPFILAGELAGPEAVGAVQSWALAANWVATFVVAQFFPIVNRALDRGRVFFVFAVMAIIFFLFVSWWVPESKGKKDADEVWGRESRRED